MATDERGAALVRNLVAGGRLVTLTGPAGNGKSHLARVVAARWARRHLGAVHLMELETLVDGIALLEEAAATLAMPPPAGHAVLRALADHIGSARTLLVLDGCDGIVDSCTRLAAALLSRCPRLALLATSRTALGLPGEVTWSRPGLPAWHPAGDDLAEPEPDEGARLLLRWSQRWRSPQRPGNADPAAAARICWRLHGLPRALELVSPPLALLGATAVETALSRADGPLVPEDALRAALALSYQALPGQLRGLLRRLTVFAAEFTADSAASVCGVGPASPPLEPAFDELTRRGLLRRRRGRSGLTLYRLPAGEGTAVSRWAPESRVWTELAGRRRRYYLDLAGTVSPIVGGADGLACPAGGRAERAPRPAR